MKLDKRLVITLIILAIILLGYKLINYYYPKESNHTIVVDMNAIKVINEINLPYVNIYLYSDGKAYLVPINKNEISKLESGNNLKDRLITLYNNSTTLDKKYDNQYIKGYSVNLDDLVEKIYNVVVNDKSYIIFLKENNKIALFDYDSYYNLMYTEVMDNYNNVENVLKIENDNLYYLDNSVVKLNTLIK